jgi:DTW domain-containing protein
LISEKFLKNKSPQVFTARAFCYKCWKVEAICLCKYIKPVDSKVQIGIVQHPNEKFMPINTARLAHLSFSNSFMESGICFDEHPNFQNRLKDFSEGEVGILYPSENSILLEEADERLKCLIVVDGTWTEARKILHRSKCLKELPRYHFIPAEESRYEIRREPKKEYVSSLEAIVLSLRSLEKSPLAYQSLLEVFYKMIETQKDYIANKGNARHKGFGGRKRDRLKIGEMKRILYSSTLEERRAFFDLNNVDDLIKEYKEIPKGDFLKASIS